jgi:hypothetical protein
VCLWAFLALFLFPFYYYHHCCTNGRKRGVLLTIGSLENEMGAWDLLFFFCFTMLLLAFTDRPSRVLEETDTEPTCICRIE